MQKMDFPKKMTTRRFTAFYKKQESIKLSYFRKYSEVVEICNILIIRYLIGMFFCTLFVPRYL